MKLHFAISHDSKHRASPRMNFTDQYVQRCFVLEGTSDTVLQFPSNAYVINQIIVCVINSLLIITTVFLNSIAILTIYRCIQLKEKICYFLIALQSTIDLLTGAVSIPLFTFVLASELTGTASCVVNFLLTTVAFIPMALSLVMLCGISFERYMGVLHPLSHRTQMTRKRFLGYLCCTTVAIVIMMIMSVVYKMLYHIFSAINICLSLLLITFVYTNIFLTARRRSYAENRPGYGVVNLNPTQKKRKEDFMKEIKLAKSCFIVLIAFMVCFTPVTIISVLSVTVSREMVPKFRLFQSWCITLALFNHSLNSILFFWTRPILKKEAKKVLKDIYTKTFVE